LSSGYYDAYFAKAAKVRTLIKNDFLKAFADCSAILMPVSPTPAFKLGEKMSDPLTMYLADIFTISVNLSATPSLAFPVGLNSHKLPLGLQFIGKHFDELTLFKLAKYIEDEHPELVKLSPELI
jgi:aspartyl-tRNA(Asn)/glutamyl-tRNA(Gln) amidotransferase subunit A